VSHTVMVGAVRALAAAANEQGVDGGAIARRHVPEGLLNDPDGRVPFQQYRAAMAEFIDECGDTIGLRAGARAALGTTLEYLTRTSSTLGGALGHIVRYASLTADRATIEMHEAEGVVEYTFQAPIEVIPEVPTVMVRQSIEGFLALVVSLGRSITITRWTPTEVRFSYARPDDVAELQQFFGAPLVFEAERSGLVLPSSLLNLSVVTADTQLNLILAACCATLLQELPKTQDLKVDVMRKLTAAVPHGDHSIDQIARKLGMSGRTLQRRLADEGLSFHDVLDETRRLLAQRYLAESSLSITDTALLLGYSEQRAFHRAFKRWNGRTPADYRAAQRR